MSGIYPLARSDRASVQQPVPVRNELRTICQVMKRPISGLNLVEFGYLLERCVMRMFTGVPILETAAYTSGAVISLLMIGFGAAML
jgi:hypothetical protein